MTSPIISVARANAAESAVLSFVVSLSEPSDEAVTVSYRVMAGTAVPGDLNYGELGLGTLTIAAGDTTGIIEVEPDFDSDDEVDESIWLDLFNAQNGVLAGGESRIGTLGVVLDEDGAGSNLSLFVSNPQLTEGNGGTKTAVFEIHLSQPHGSNLTFNYTTADGTAKAGSDYAAKSGTVTFLAGQTVASVAVDIVGDSTIEASEFFSLVVTPTSEIKNGKLGSTGKATILDDEDGNGPTISVARAGSTESGALLFEVSLSEASDEAVTVDYRAMAGTAVPDDLNYGALGTGTLTIAAGKTTGFIVVEADTDSDDEVDESVWLDLFNAKNGELAGGASKISALGVVLDEDGAGSNLAMFVSSSTLVEGDSGAKKAVFEVHLSRPHSSDLTFNYTTADGTAKAGSDYVAKTGTVTFRAGQTAASVEIDVSGDSTVEASEFFSLVVTPSSEIKNGTLGSTGRTTIIDNDGNGPTISVVRADSTESGDLLFEVSLSEASDEAVTVDFRARAGTAVPNDLNYGALGTGTLTIAAGDTTGFIRVTADSDSDDEVDESVWLDLFNAQNGVLAGGASKTSALGVVRDEDGSGSNLAMFVSSPQLVEGDTGTKKAVFEVHLSRPHGSDLIFEYTTGDGTAKSGSDYVAKTGTVTFLAGQTVASVEVDVKGDSTVEASEFFSLVVTPTSEIKNGTKGSAAEATILDDDSDVPTISVTRAEATESDDLLFEVSLSSASLEDVTIDFRATAGTAVPDDLNYGALGTGTLTIAAGDTTGFIRVEADTDSDDEVDESVWLELFNPKQAVLAGGESSISALGVLLDEDGSGSNLALFVSNPTLKEGTGGAKKAVFEVHLSRPHSDDLTLNYTTADGTAKAGSDYTARSGTVTFLAGQTVASVEVDVTGDRAVELTETFSLVVTATSEIKNTSPAHAGTATILNDDSIHELLVGDGGPDKLNGHDGNDTLRGLGGNDTLNGGADQDRLEGGDGNDLYIFTAGDTIVEAAKGGTDTVRSSLSYTLGANVENLELTGRAALNGAGNKLANEISGNKGKNELGGGKGKDTLNGNGGKDTLDGGKGADKLAGGTGADMLTGGRGKDAFVFNALKDSTTKTKGMDTILDFKHSQGDRIDLSALDAKSTRDGNQKFAFIGTDAFTDKAGQLRYETKSGDTFVQGDVDGDGRADFSIRFDDALTLVKGDFIL